MEEVYFDSYEMDGHSFDITFGRPSDQEPLMVIAVRDQSSDTHYVSEELDRYDMGTTRTIEGGDGIPEIEENVPMRKFDYINKALRDGDRDLFEASLSSLTEEELTPATSSSEKARRKLEMYDHEIRPQSHSI